jgi:hypothetical protein
MNEVMNEPFGFKVSMTGGVAWVASLLQGIDLTQMLGFVALVVGVFIQIVSYYRNTRADRRAIEADERDKLQYDLQMRVLAKELAEIEKRVSNDNK